MKTTSNKNIQKLIKFELRENKIQHQQTYQIAKKHRRKASTNK